MLDRLAQEKLFTKGVKLSSGQSFNKKVSEFSSAEDITKTSAKIEKIKNSITGNRNDNDKVKYDFSNFA